MVQARMYYKQTPNERYNSDMSDDVQQVLKDYGITIEGWGGGVSFVGYAEDAMCADEDLDIYGSRMDIRLAQRELSARFERPIGVEYITLWSKLKDNVRWFLLDWGFVK